ncbi:HPr family phosphocarrier protein [Biformimicrobium ophioploci]|uniref:HPr family phosphocarrier protein n=1 Tax=Biformimicrobium ophioploci TaxID=3036711 RepID=A0ABQ6LWX1_9GAMM|nr:HPr family phosphocarrier protein [Microbulbifer sp. NKW57]GMG86595.1 HPr family phosphocarrier protein [Microbulbifer sp. NKW57]
MPSTSLTICNKLGLHARAAAKMAKLAGRYGAQINILCDGKTVDAKSVMSLMLLAAGKGTEIKIQAEGDDADDALEALQALVEDRFGEEC